MRNGFVAGQAQSSTYASGGPYFHSLPSYLDEEETMKAQRVHVRDPDLSARYSRHRLARAHYLSAHFLTHAQPACYTLDLPGT
jgi:hypothetical protein